MFRIEELILNALNEKEIFIGYYMLCRYLNGKGYIRYGCNAGYEGVFKPKSNPKNKRNPCKILCPNTKIYRSKIKYWCEKLAKNNKILLEKKLFPDSKNPNSQVDPHKFDLFVIITKGMNFD